MTIDILVFIYKIASLLVGLSFAFMGYRLFKAGIWGDSGEFSGEFGDNRLLLKRAAPGTFFTVSGAIIIAIVLVKGIVIDEYEKPTDNNTTQVKLDKDNKDQKTIAEDKIKKRRIISTF